MARSAGDIWPLYDLLQSFRSMGRAGLWDLIMDALIATHGAAVQMIDTSIVRAHQHGACIAGNDEQQTGRSRDGPTIKIHAAMDKNGLPVQLGLAAGETHDNRLCSVILSELSPWTMLLANRGYDAIFSSSACARCRGGEWQTCAGTASAARSGPYATGSPILTG
jgi:hypothetical protein